MTIIQFPTQQHPLMVKRGEIEALAALLGGFIIWPDDQRAALTPRESEALTYLGRKPRTTQSIAVDLYVSARGAHYLLSALARKGYAQRVGKHVGGGWVAVPSAPAIPLAEAA
jgi:DNA-binding CsgD family transcriptional regulator